MSRPWEELCGTQEDPGSLASTEKKTHHKGIYSNTFPAVGVDMIHHETDILLRIGSTWITIKNVGAQISLTVVFDRFGT